MKEHPIIFSGPMVRAILDGRKTQTRRVRGLDYVNAGPDNFKPMTPEEWMAPTSQRPALGGYPKDRALFKRFTAGQAVGGVALLCPYGQPGDRLWVRETWNCPRQLGGSHQREKLVFRADEGKFGVDYSSLLWAPSIHMPRWASRITLEVTGVRVERLDDMGETDAIFEGVEPLVDETQEDPWVWVIEFKRLAEDATVTA